MSAFLALYPIQDSMFTIRLLVCKLCLKNWFVLFVWVFDTLANVQVLLVWVFDVLANVQILHVWVFAGCLLSTGHFVTLVSLVDTTSSLSSPS